MHVVVEALGGRTELLAQLGESLQRQPRPVLLFAQQMSPEQMRAALSAGISTLQLAGLAWQVAAKVTLGRSFGLLPAARGLVTSGPYRVVRHPIYLGYLITHLAFVAANPTMWNVATLGAMDSSSTIYPASF